MSPLLSDIAHIWLRELEPTLSRYAIFTIGVWLLLWVILKPLLQARKIREETPAPRQLWTEFLFSLRSMAVFATVGVLMTLMYRAGLYPLGAIADTWGPVWFAFSLVAGIMGLDAWFYWSHRLMHK